VIACWPAVELFVVIRPVGRTFPVAGATPSRAELRGRFPRSLSIREESPMSTALSEDTLSGCYQVTANHPVEQVLAEATAHAPRWELDQQRDPDTGEPVQFQLVRCFAADLAR
jgi:hypothetical protein